MTTIHVLRSAELTDDLVAAWSAIQAGDRELESPYFRPEFTLAVAAVRSDVRVALIEESGKPAGFFPFQLGRFGAAKPVAGRLSDYHGLIAKPGLKLSARMLLEGCRVRSWAFDHLPASQPTFAPYHLGTMSSPQLDLSRGFEAYVAEKRAVKSSEVKDALMKLRKLQRDVGPVRVELDCRDRTVFETLLRWKSDQYRRTGLSDLFSFGWIVRLVEHVWEQRSDAFGGRLSALWANEALVAVHFGMQSFGTLHSWFPAYDVAYAKHSPGALLLLEMARLGAEAGIRTIDLGKGEERYKLGFANAGRLLAEGVVRRGHLSRHADASWRSLRTWLKTGPLAAPASASARALRPVRERLSFR